MSTETPLLSPAVVADEVPKNEVEILPKAADRIRRPLCLIGEYAYAVTWLPIRRTIRTQTDSNGKVTHPDPPLILDGTALVVVRSDGAVFSGDDLPISVIKPLRDLGLTVALPAALPDNRIWSPAGFTRYLEGIKPDPADVFRRTAKVFDRFMDFSRSLASQEVMCELAACYVMGTYLLDAFNVIGYLWPNGDKGCGKTHFLFTLTEMAYLGQVILAGGSYAALRDMADVGATLAFDDAEGIMDARKSDPDKRALLLAGNRKGATVPVKEPTGTREWRTRYINTFCPRLFSAIRLPDDVLASRTITVPLVRSVDSDKAKADPLDHGTWPSDRQALVDDLWAVGLDHLALVHHYDGMAATMSQLQGRDLDPWRSILAVALWLDERCGLKDLYTRMAQLSIDYQSERSTLEYSDVTRLTIQALGKMLKGSLADPYVFSTIDLMDEVNKLAVEEEVAGVGEFINAKRLGRLLERLRLTKAPRTSEHKRWQIRRDEYRSLKLSYGMGLDTPGANGTNGTNGIMAPQP